MGAENGLSRAVESAMSEIRRIIAGSEVEEDPAHAEDTLALVLELEPKAGPDLRIAALGHDIERALPREKRIDRSSYCDYDAFKAAHARNSAKVLTGLLSGYNLPAPLIRRVHKLVEEHESGGSPDSDLLKEADSLSFFRTNLPYYLAREGWDAARRRCRWGLQRLGPRGRRLLRSMTASDPLLKRLLSN